MKGNDRKFTFFIRVKFLVRQIPVVNWVGGDSTSEYTLVSSVASNLLLKRKRISNAVDELYSRYLEVT
jgi:hypothetical protein